MANLNALSFIFFHLLIALSSMCLNKCSAYCSCIEYPVYMIYSIYPVYMIYIRVYIYTVYPVYMINLCTKKRMSLYSVRNDSVVMIMLIFNHVENVFKLKSWLKIVLLNWQV